MPIIFVLMTQINSPIQWGPMSAWTLMLLSVILLALVEYLRRHFVTKEKGDTQLQMVCNKIDELKREVAKLDAHIAAAGVRNESTMVNRHEFNGITVRMDQFQKDMAEVTADARAAHVLATQVSTDLRYLTQRFADLLGPINEKLDSIYKWKMLEHRSLKDDEKP